MMCAQRRVKALAALAGMALLGGGEAAAAPLRFGFSGAVNGSFVIDSAPTPTYVVSGAGFYAIAGGGTGAFAALAPIPAGPAAPANLGFVLGSHSPAIGGLSLFANVGPGINFIGPQQFGGTEAAPLFAPGTFALTEEAGGGAVALTIAPGAPSPAIGGGLAAALAAVAGLVLARGRRRSFS